MRLEGKVALITGAANGVEGRLMGFGGAAARLFSREGATVVVADIDEESGKLTAKQINNEGGEAVFFRLDVTSEVSWAAAVEATIARYSKLDVLVNNAGTASRADVEGTTLEMWEEQMATHSTATFLGTRTAIPEMRSSGGGSIINVSSIFGLVGSPSSTAYHAAKGASRIFTKAAAVQYAKEGIRVNSVHPGFVTTPMTAPFFSDPELMNPRLATVPMGRLGLADEIASGILFLASDEASFVTGAELVIDGGFTAQ
ncbi:MAG: glucose 1-dehydrogenase [SAR202 cluster bacterium]|nr:glucose 1-dehydrogenase [SAR202 cluster bacterium]